MISAGKFRHAISIQSRTSSIDAFGGTVFTWENWKTGVRAEVKPISGRELVAAQAVQSEISYRFTIRYIAGVLPEMRIVHNGKNHDIKAILNFNEMNQELQIMTTSGVSEG